VLSYDPIKIGFFHYFFDISRAAGVFRVDDANIKALQDRYPNFEPVFIAGDFRDGVFDKYEQREMNLNYRRLFRDFKAKKISKQLEYLTEDLDAIIFENPLRGINSIVTKGIKDFSENSDKQIIYRNHDFIINYPDDHKRFLKDFNSLRDIFPKSSNVIQTALTSSTKYRIEEFLDDDVFIFKNSVVCEDYLRKDDGKDEELERLLLDKGILKPGEKPLPYAIRADKRKNGEEALTITKMLNDYHGGNYKLIITASRDIEFKRPEENIYQRNLEKFAKAHDIPYSIGEVSKYIDGKNFSIGNLYHISDLAITTAIQEGFGYAYIEPWISGTPLIGRRIREVCEDFEKNGLRFNHLYDSSFLPDGRNWEKRMKRFDKLLRDKGELIEVVKTLNLPSRIDKAIRYLGDNVKAIGEAYDHGVVIDDVIKMLKLPGYEKLEKVV